MYAVTIYFFTFPIIKELYIFLKEKTAGLFKLYQAPFICKKIAGDDDAYLGWGWSEIGLFRIKELIFL